MDNSSSEGIRFVAVDRFDRFSAMGKDRMADVVGLCRQADDDFVPPLRERGADGAFTGGDGEDVGAYALHLKHHEGIVPDVEGPIPCFMAFRQEGDTLHVSCLIVEGAHRRQGLARGMYARLMDEARLRRAKHIRTRTWLDPEGERSNDAHMALLESLGFERTLVVHGDRPGGIASAHFVLEL